MDIALLIAFVLFVIVGVMLAVLQLPGTWMILLLAIGYDWYYGWQKFGWKWLVALTVFAALAEAVDSIASIVATQRAGASRRAAFGAIIGGFAGMLLFSIPVPVIGTVIGGLLGCFVGALIAEMTKRSDLFAGAKVGLFATIGRVIGLVAKTAAAMAIAGAALSLAIRGMW